MRTTLIATKGGKKPRVQREAAMQRSLFTWAGLQEKVLPGLRWLNASANGMPAPVITRRDGSKCCLAKAAMRSQGMKPGVPDIHLPVARCGFHSLYLELKAGDNRLSPEQKEWVAGMRAEGHAVFVVYDDWQHAAEIVREYLAGTLRNGERGRRNAEKGESP